MNFRHEHRTVVKNGLFGEKKETTIVLQKQETVRSGCNCDPQYGACHHSEFTDVWTDVTSLQDYEVFLSVWSLPS